MSRPHQCAFTQRKVHTLDKLDKSPKGSIDRDILELVRFVNEQPDFCTTSSCSGRVALFRRNLSSRPEEQESSACGTAEDVPPKKIEQKGGNWLFVDHEPLSAEYLDSELENILFRSDSSASGETVAAPEFSDDTLLLMYEPFLLHVEARDLGAAKTLLRTAFACGCRESGMTVSADDRVMVQIRSNAFHMEVPFCLAGDSGGVFHKGGFRSFLCAQLFERHTQAKARLRKLSDRLIEDLAKLSAESSDPVVLGVSQSGFATLYWQLRVRDVVEPTALTNAIAECFTPAGRKRWPELDVEKFFAGALPPPPEVDAECRARIARLVEEHSCRRRFVGAGIARQKYAAQQDAQCGRGGSSFPDVSKRNQRGCVVAGMRAKADGAWIVPRSEIYKWKHVAQAAGFFVKKIGVQQIGEDRAVIALSAEGRGYEKTEDGTLCPAFVDYEEAILSGSSSSGEGASAPAALQEEESTSGPIFTDCPPRYSVSEEGFGGEFPFPMILCMATVVSEFGLAEKLKYPDLEEHSKTTARYLAVGAQRLVELLPVPDVLRDTLIFNAAKNTRLFTLLEEAGDRQAALWLGTLGLLQLTNQNYRCATTLALQGEIENDAFRSGNLRILFQLRDIQSLHLCRAGPTLVRSNEEADSAHIWLEVDVVPCSSGGKPAAHSPRVIRIPYLGKDLARTKLHPLEVTSQARVHDHAASMVRVEIMSSSSSIGGRPPASAAANTTPVSTPALRIGLVGGFADPWLVNKENGILYTWDSSRTMFCRGNVPEKIRTATWPLRAGEVVVDMFAGIGYWTLILLAAQKKERPVVSKIFACEWNPASVDALERGFTMNFAGKKGYAVMRHPWTSVPPTAAAAEKQGGRRPTTDPVFVIQKHTGDLLFLDAIGNLNSNVLAGLGGLGENTLRGDEGGRSSCGDSRQKKNFNNLIWREVVGDDDTDSSYTSPFRYSPTDSEMWRTRSLQEQEPVSDETTLDSSSPPTSGENDAVLEIVPGDCQSSNTAKLLTSKAHRVLLGILPSSQSFLNSAMEYLNWADLDRYPDGLWLHVHENVRQGDEETFVFELRTNLHGKAHDILASRGLLKYNNFRVDVSKHKVKSYAPRVNHLVIDVNFYLKR